MHENSSPKVSSRSHDSGKVYMYGANIMVNSSNLPPKITRFEKNSKYFDQIDINIEKIFVHIWCFVQNALF